MYVWIYKNCVKIGAKLSCLTVVAIACSQAAATLEYPRGLPSRRVGADNPDPWLPADTKPGPRGVGWVKEGGMS